MTTPKQLVFYQTDNGDEPFNDWLEELDTSIRARVLLRLDRVRLGNYGDRKSVGQGVHELRFFFGSGYRAYFAEVGNTIVLLLTGGDKGNQNKDIAKAQSYWRDYQILQAKAAQEKDQKKALQKEKKS
jgi:putative addiction module killer protein